MAMVVITAKRLHHDEARGRERRKFWSPIASPRILRFCAVRYTESRAKHPAGRGQAHRRPGVHQVRTVLGEPPDAVERHLERKKNAGGGDKQHDQRQHLSAPAHAGEELQVADDKVLVTGQKVAQELQHDVVHLLRMEHAANHGQQQDDERKERQGSNMPRPRRHRYAPRSASGNAGWTSRSAGAGRRDRRRPPLRAETSSRESSCACRRFAAVPVRSAVACKSLVSGGLGLWTRGLRGRVQGLAVGTPAARVYCSSIFNRTKAGRRSGIGQPCRRHACFAKPLPKHCDRNTCQKREFL